MLTSSGLLRIAASANTLASGQVLYVDDDATGPGTGAVDDPFPGIQEALDDPACVPGATVAVQPGEYDSFSTPYQTVRIAAVTDPMRTVVRVQPGATPGGRLSGLVEVEGLWFRGPGGPSGQRQGRGIVADLGSFCTVTRCVFSDLAVGVGNSYDLGVMQCMLVRCDVGYDSLGQDNGGFLNTSFWQVETIDVPGLAGPPRYNGCHFGNPLTFGPNDFHLRRQSPLIDAGVQGVVPAVDPDGSPLDIGPYPYDWNHPFGESYCFNPENSTGQRGRVRLAGTASLSRIAAGEALYLSATHGPPWALGIFVVGNAGGEISLGISGAICLSGSLRRHAVAFLDGNGIAQRTWLEASSLTGLQPGDRLGAQFWHRDIGPGLVRLTHAVQVELLP